MNFKQKLNAAIKKNNSLLCIGLDTDKDKIPSFLIERYGPNGIFDFNRQIIDNTLNLVCCYKINSAFYEAFGATGIEQLYMTCMYIKEIKKDIPIILDAKRSDIGNTARMYAKSAFEYLGVDGITINPYLGTDSVEPFLEYKDKGIIIVCKSSNPGAWDFQDLEVEGEPLYIKVAKKTLVWNRQSDNCLMVVGPTKDMKRIREIAPDMFFLVPGIGAQGGDLQKVLELGLTTNKSGLLIHSARAIIYASNKEDFAKKAREEAEKLRDEINKYR